MWVSEPLHCEAWPSSLRPTLQWDTCSLLSQGKFLLWPLWSIGQPTLQPAAFQPGSAVPLLPSIAGTRNPRVDVAVPIASTNPSCVMCTFSSQCLAGSRGCKVWVHLMIRFAPWNACSEVRVQSSIQRKNNLCKMKHKCSPVPNRSQNIWSCFTVEGV
ncbi:hypothetical protein HJG60_007908 [Phyllostomus discolor]|uniref:Uncharacterized protein n=1 Tax=Phyllostomus discolor TaxID=89673 RepID=A0A834EVR8_9CHIR|nr:hypothetical protein HJG60_007908 [Phyllostomus discolor]